jgi:ComF family protein
MIKGWIENLLHLVYPNLCVVCSENLMEEENSICFSCLSQLPYTHYHLQRDNPIEKRFWGKVPVERATSLFFYEKATSTQHLLQALKYKGEKEIGVVLGKQLGTFLNQSLDFASIDMIIPVPLHPKKLQKRGFNQSECICEGIAGALRKPINTSTLVRAIENPTQTKKGVYERWENTTGIFALSEPDMFKDKHLLLVDDVLTTGSTIEACVQAIVPVTGAKVSVATLAVA